MTQNTYLLPLSEISEASSTLDLIEEALWQKGIREFGLNASLRGPITVHLSLSRMAQGCRIQGTLAGTINLPCDRCAEVSPFELSWHFDDFETMPDVVPTEDEATLNPEESHIRIENGNALLDLSALLWEEFCLALPPQHLCQANCKGLCPHCGANLNEGPCHCAEDKQDPRMALFRTLRIAKKE